MDKADWNTLSIDFIEQFCDMANVGVIIRDGVIKGAVKEGKNHEQRK